ncbi:class I SAM-dependent methyltransferase [Diaphorobacter caeni]|uniref:class I SAM-dependent methyltransferase n=1 Tax=Diaphorobacter caeni TaxID=2784387 RepID=UPI00188E5AE0|nr:methyltransferase domain-containing protein [Diaphorobacter caeni]MBF5003878.1 methyltransferase domain-containing protein [Diaphorobacter caeni]
MSTESFYRAFEDRYRGSRELIRERLEAYLPFVRPLLTMYPEAEILDLGCGRGEWLELLRDQGFRVRGIDKDTGMLAACLERGLTVEQGDALAFLRALPDNTLNIVSGFHFIEHIPFEALDELMTQARRVLKPGGLLILETPNPENLVVGSCNFYLDPTHQRPIPPLLLSFLAQFHEFARVKILRMQESAALHEEGAKISLSDVLEGVSPDYGIIAQKVSDASLARDFDVAFQRDYGLDLRQLANLFETQHVGRSSTEITALQSDYEARHAGLLDRVSLMQQDIARMQEQMSRDLLNIAQIRSRQQEQDGLIERLHIVQRERDEALLRVQTAQEFEAQMTERLKLLEQERDALRRSFSWRVMAPVRFVVGCVMHPGATVRGVANSTLTHSINLFQRPLAVVMRPVLRNPLWSARINQKLARFPALHQHLMQISQRWNPALGASLENRMGAINLPKSVESLGNFGQQIYIVLNTELDKQNASKEK